MKTIGDLLYRDLSRKIEEIIQVDQADEQSVHAEITEYVATDSIREQYHQLFRAIAEAPSEPHEGVGVWVSGFFGSGKSSFAKFLGYALQNRTVLGTPFAILFKQQLGDPRIADLLDSIHARTPTGVILFEVAKERDTRRVTERIAELMYTVLLRELDYAEDFDIAELEIELEAEGRLDEFVAACNKLHHQDWRMVRKGAQRLSRASAVLHELDPKTYPSADSWAHAQRNRDAAVNVSKVVERSFELWGRRRKGQALVFIIDEVGQHVGRSGDKIEDLRAVVEEFGKVGKNLLKQRKIPAPCWIIVTSQEKLDEVVAAIDSKRVELAKLQDRFRYRVDLAPSDIREVATKRVLAKKKEAEPVLKKLFSKNQGALHAALRLERTSRRTDITEEDFVQFYPYPPHYIDLCISIMSGIRLQPGAPRHYGGSNRTIIKQAYEMLVSERTAFARQPLGALVTLDKVYELVEGNLSNEKRTDLHEIRERFQKDAEDRGWALRVAKVICLLEFVRDLPRTEANLAAFLVDEVGKPAPLPEVQAAVKRLHGAQFIRSTEEGWKLQTAQEKTWETERRGHLEPKPRERNELLRQALQDIFAEPEFKIYRYQNLRSFRIGILVDGTPLGDEGDLPLNLSFADDSDDFTKKLAEVREESRLKAHENDLYWVFYLTPEIDELVAQAHASRKMVEKYDQLRAQNKITQDETSCLQDEKNSEHRYRSLLRDKLTEAMERGSGLFRGVQKDAASLGKGLGEVLKKLFGEAVPAIYPKLEMGARPLKGDEAEQILKAADLKALPSVFYAGDNGLGLVVKDGAKNVVCTTADVAKEILEYLKAEHIYGNKDSCMGKALERRFTGPPYGWEPDLVRLVLAALFRAGEIEVTSQGNRYTNYQDPLSRTVFTKLQAFRSALFSPRVALGPKLLSQAAQQLEALIGEEVDVEANAIAAKLKQLAAEEQSSLQPLKTWTEVYRLAVVPLLEEYRQTLDNIAAAASDDCVKTLAESGSQFAEMRDKVRKIRQALTEQAFERIGQARTAVEQVWPQLDAQGAAPEIGQVVNELKALLASDQVADSLPAIAAKTQAIMDAYRQAYLDLFDRRAAAFEQALAEIQTRPEWEGLVRKDRTQADALLEPLRVRMGSPQDRQAVADGSALGRATLAEMASYLAALDGLRRTALVQLQELALGGQTQTPVRRVPLTQFFQRPIQTRQDLEAILEQLRSTLQKMLDEGATIVVE
jgi:hypothetical protein